MTVDKEQLFKPRLPEEEFEIPGIGTVRIRGLSRIEVMLVQKAEGLPAQEARMLRYGMVEPKLTEAEAEKWQKASPGGTGGELELVTERISHLSGMTPAAEREAYRNFRGQPRSGVRALPSGEAGHDGGSATPEHEQ